MNIFDKIYGSVSSLRIKGKSNSFSPETEFVTDSSGTIFDSEDDAGQDALFGGTNGETVQVPFPEATYWRNIISTEILCTEDGFAICTEAGEEICL